VVCLPTARRAARPAVHNQVFRPLADFFVKIVHEHAHSGFLLPAFAGEHVSAWRANGRVTLPQSFNLGGHHDDGSRKLSRGAIS